jgi:repressor of nif and glnA expression
MQDNLHPDYLEPLRTLISQTAEIIGSKGRGSVVDRSDYRVKLYLKLWETLSEFVVRWESEKPTDTDGVKIRDEAGAEELDSALVRDKVGLAISRIELLAFRTNFDWNEGAGSVPVNVSFFPKGKFDKVLQVMKPVFEAGLCVSDRVAVAREGEQLGDLIVPEGTVGLATVCSIVINGTLLKAGVPMDSRFGGILQMRSDKPLRFVELIHYAGCSLDPSEIFIRARMTSVRQAARSGDGKILANFREIPAVCRPLAEEIVNGLKEAGLHALMVMGDVSGPVCEVPVEMNKIGMVLLGGLNPVAAAEEAGIAAENHAMSTVMEYQDLIKFKEL